MSAATARIELSRERLRLAMDPPPEPERPRTERPFVDRVMAMPILNDVLESLRHWWAAHPMRPIGLVAGEAVNAVARPVALRHPWLLVLGAGETVIGQTEAFRPSPRYRGLYEAVRPAL